MSNDDRHIKEQTKIMKEKKKGKVISEVKDKEI